MLCNVNFHLQAFQFFMQNRPWAWDLSAAATYRRRLYLITIFGISFNLPRKCRNSEDWVTSLREKAKLFLCWNIEVGCGEWRGLCPGRRQQCLRQSLIRGGIAPLWQGWQGWRHLFFFLPIWQVFYNFSLFFAPVSLDFAHYVSCFLNI